MRQVRRMLNDPILLWLLLAFPAAVMLQGYLARTLIYGELMHASGEIGARLLIVALAITPLRLLFPQASWLLWLAARRRYFGVAAFGYALLHAALYLQRVADFTKITSELTDASMWTGWLALAIMVPLALTSNNRSVRRLHRAWKSLHRLGYLVAALTFAHWLLAAFDPISGILHFSLLAALETFRLWRAYASNGPRHA